MSSGNIDKNSISFDLTSGGIVGVFNLIKIEGNELNPDKILLKMTSRAVGANHCSSDNSTSVIIDKANTKVLAHFFRQAADLMNDWYAKE